MNLNDPFGRLRQRDEADYESLRQTLAGAGIDSIDAARRVMANTGRNVLVFSAVVVTATSALLLLFPRMAPVTLALALLLLAIAGNALIKGRRCVKRYMAEQLGPGATAPHGRTTVGTQRPRG